MRLIHTWRLPVKIVGASIALTGLLTSWGTAAFAETSSVSLPSESYSPIPELNYKAPTSKEDDYSVFDDCRLHAGAAFISSFQNVPLSPAIRAAGGLRGVDFNFGVDLFSNHWIVQGDLVSLAQTPIEDAQVSANGFELRLMYDTPVYEAVTIHLGMGLANRIYDIKTVARADGSVAAGDRTFQSGATVLAAGAEYWVTESFSTGLELTNHMPMSNGDDPSSFDLGIRVNGHF